MSLLIEVVWVSKSVSISGVVWLCFVVGKSGKLEKYKKIRAGVEWRKEVDWTLT